MKPLLAIAHVVGAVEIDRHRCVLTNGRSFVPEASCTHETINT